MEPDKIPVYYVALYSYKNASIYGEYPEDIRGRHHGNYGTDGGHKVSVECLIIDEEGYTVGRYIDNWLPVCLFLGKKEGDEITVPVLILPEIEVPDDFDFDEDLEQYQKKSAEEKHEINKKETEERKPIGTRMVTLKLFQTNPKYHSASTFEEEVARATAKRDGGYEHLLFSGMYDISKEKQRVIWREFEELVKQ